MADSMTTARRLGGLVVLAVVLTAGTARAQGTNGFFGAGGSAYAAMAPTFRPVGSSYGGPSYYTGGSYGGYYAGRGYVGPGFSYGNPYYYGGSYGGYSAGRGYVGPGFNYGGSYYGGSYYGAPSYATPRSWAGVNLPR